MVYMKVIPPMSGMLILFLFLPPLFAQPQTNTSDFSQAKTLFQTNSGYDPRIALGVDGVIVHLHGTNRWKKAIASWQQKGYRTGRMFFADSDAGNVFWKGKWNGKEYPQDVERRADGQVVKCANVRPYMLPTEDWIRYLEEMTQHSLETGAGAILPEEPLAHVHTGYEESFKTLWQQRYDRPWEAENQSHEARFLTGQLKAELYNQLEHRLLQLTRNYSRQHNKSVSFVVPIHSLYSNIAAQLTTPLGISGQMGPIDGYIGQIWTGPVNWALGNYDSPQKSFFSSAFVLYDYFTQLTVANDKTLWLLIDPVEDNPHHTWSEFAEWYQHCAVAMLLMREVDRYEVMPWPDRIFLPGHATGGKTPAPEEFRTRCLSVTQVLQDIPRGGTWLDDTGRSVRSSEKPNIGIAVADTFMWEKNPPPKLQGIYGLMLPLVEQGIPVSSMILERAVERDYMKRFQIIVVSFEEWKPQHESLNLALVEWVRQGGTLLVLGQDGDELDRCKNFWWHQVGFSSPLAHLLKNLERPHANDLSWRLGKGYVYRKSISPRDFSEPQKSHQEYLPLLETAVKQSTGKSLQTPGYFCMRRGPFLIAHSRSQPVQITGRYLDVFDPELAIREGVFLSAGESGIYRNVYPLYKENEPSLLHCTHRLVWEKKENQTLRFLVRGPAETPGVARIFIGLLKRPRITGQTRQGQNVPITTRTDDLTMLLQWPNDPVGITIEVK
jgi:hypothetical protein